MEMWRKNRLKRINLLEGSVSSGKTWISLVLWAFWVKTMPADKLYMMCAKSLTTLERNCMILLQELVGEDNFTYSLNQKKGQLFGHKILLEGANDARSESKIRGITLQGAYCDELTQFPREFFTMLLSRLRLPGAKLIATTNPDSPSHWLKTEYIDRQKDLDFLSVKFLLDDNTTLPEDYVKNIKAEYTGIFYERFILGEWTLAEGVIYPMYKKAIEEPSDGLPERYVLSIDYGTQNAFAALLWGKYGDVWYAVDEYYYSGRDTGIQKTDEEYARDLDKFTARVKTSLPTIIDPSAASFITLLRRKKDKYKVKPADNAVMDGIRNTATALDQGYIKISPKCENWAIEAGGYVWDDDPSEDRPVKIGDHCLTGDTLVATERGSVPIKELVGKTGKVYSYSRFFKKKVLRKFWGVRKTQSNALIYSVRLKDGSEIKCTKEHRILTQRGYIEVQWLKSTDRIIKVEV